MTTSTDSEQVKNKGLRKGFGSLTQKILHAGKRSQKSEELALPSVVGSSSKADEATTENSSQIIVDASKSPEEEVGVLKEGHPEEKPPDAHSKEVPPEATVNVPDANDEGTSSMVPKVSADDAEVASAGCAVKSQSSPSQEHEITAELWDAAYDSLREEFPTLLDAYETILSHYLVREYRGDLTRRRSSAGVLSDMVAREHPLERRKQMNQIFDCWLRVGQGKKSANVDEEHAVEDNADQEAQHLRDIVGVPGQRSRHAALAWVASCLAAEQSLLHPNLGSNEARSGIIYILSRMEWYLSLSRLLLGSSYPIEEQVRNKSENSSLKSRLIDLYKAILRYQIKESVAPVLQHIHPQAEVEADRELIQFQEQALARNFGGQPVETQLRKLFETYTTEDPVDADPDGKSMVEDDNDAKKKDENHTPSSESLDSSDDFDFEAPDPLPSKENNVLGLLYEWVLTTEDYQEFLKWNGDNSCRLLWVTGAPGAGKTMLVSAISLALEEEAKNKTSSSRKLAYYFCDSSKFRRGGVTSIVKSIVGQILNENKALRWHLTKTYKLTGRDTFDDPNDFYALSTMLYSILRDDDFVPTYFVIDALEEVSNDMGRQGRSCDDRGLKDLLGLIAATVKVSNNKIKWLVSVDHDKVDVKQTSIDVGTQLHLKLDPQSIKLRDVANKYVVSKVAEIAETVKYRGNLQDKVTEKLQERSPGNFLWVNMACDSIKSSDIPWNAVHLIEELETDVQSLYVQMWDRINTLGQKDQEYCNNILTTAAIAFRPLRIEELVDFVNLPPEVDPEIMIAKMCSSFLVVRGDSAYFIHQSARDFIRKDLKQKGKLSRAHASITQSCVDVKNATKISEHGKDGSRPVNYATIFWLEHFSACEVGDPEVEVGKSISECGAGEVPVGKSLSERGDSEVPVGESLSEVGESESTLVKSIPERGVGEVQVGTTSSELGHPEGAPGKSSSERGIGKSQDPLSSFKAEPSDHQAFRNTVFSVNQFLTEHLIQWLETLKQQELLPQALSQLQSLEIALTEKMQPPKSSNDSNIYRNMTDIMWPLIQTIRDVIWLFNLFFNFNQLSEYPQNLNPKNSLLFCPSSNKLRQKLLRKGFPWLETAPLIKSNRGLSAISLHVLEGHSDWIRSCAYSPDGRLIASVSDDSTLRLWDANTGLTQHVLKVTNSDSYILRVAFCSASSQGASTMLMAACTSSIISVWDVSTAIPKDPIQASGLDLDGSTYFTDIALRSTGDKLAVAAYASITIWDFPSITNRVLVSPAEGDDEVRCLTFSPSSGNLLAFSKGNAITLWDVQEGTVRHRLEKQERQMDGLAFSPDSKLLASASDDRIVRIWDVGLGRVLRVLDAHESYANAVAFSSDGSRLASGSSDNNIKIWKLASQQDGVVPLYELEQVLEGHTSSVSSVSFAPRGQHLISGSSDRTVRIWDIAHTKQEPDAQVQEPLKNDSAENMGHAETEAISFLTFSPDGNTFASASSAGLVCIWNADNGTHQRSLKRPDPASFINSLVFSGDAKILVAASNDGKIRIWDTSSGDLKRSIDGHDNWVRSATISPDGELVASASDDTSVRVWDISDIWSSDNLLETHYREESDRIFEGHTDYVYCVAFSPDGKYLASGGDDSDVLIWELAPGKGNKEAPDKKLSDSEVSGYIRGIVFTPDGERIISTTSSETGDIVIWDCKMQTCLQILKRDAGTPGGGQLMPFWTLEMNVPNILLTESGAWQLNIPSVAASATKSLSDSLRLSNAPGSPLLEAYHGTYQSISPMPSSLSRPSIRTRAQQEPLSDSLDLADAPSSPLLEAYHGTYQSISPMPSRPGIKPLGRPNPPKSSPYGLSDDRSWITYNDRKVIFLPEPYRPSGVGQCRVKGRRVVIGSDTGRVMLFKFSKDINP